MTRKRRKNSAAQSAHRQDILHSRVRLDGAGEDPVVKALLRELPEASNEKALEIALALQKMLRGDESYLENPETAELVSDLRQTWKEMDAVAEDFDKSPTRFIDETYDRAMKKMPTGDAADRLKAKAAKQAKDIFSAARAGELSKRTMLDWELVNGPKEVINVPVQFETRVVNGQVITIKVPLTLGIRGRVFNLPPGQQSVPRVVAGLFRQWQKSHNEMDERKEVLAQQGHWGKVQKSWKELDAKYNTLTKLPA